MGVGRVSGGIGVALGTYIVAPVIVALLTNGVSETSVGGRILNAIYPKQVSDKIVDTPTPQMVSPPTATSPTVIAPLDRPKLAVEEPDVALTATPASSPMTATMGAPVIIDGNRVSIAMTLLSATDALPVFASDHGFLDGWSATVRPGNVSCYGGANELSGIGRYRDDDWKRAGDDVSKLPKSVPAPITAQFLCQGDIKAGDTITMTARLNYVANDVRVPITFYSPAMALRAR